MPEWQKIIYGINFVAVAKKWGYSATIFLIALPHTVVSFYWQKCVLHRFLMMKLRSEQESHMFAELRNSLSPFAPFVDPLFVADSTNWATAFSVTFAKKIKIKVKLCNFDKHLCQFLVYLQNTENATVLYHQITKNQPPTPALFWLF